MVKPDRQTHVLRLRHRVATVTIGECPNVVEFRLSVEPRGPASRTDNLRFRRWLGAILDKFQSDPRPLLMLFSDGHACMTWEADGRAYALTTRPPDPAAP